LTCLRPQTMSAEALKGCTLVYFPATGRAEAFRMAMAIGGIEYNHKVIPYPEWYSPNRPDSLWGTLPYLVLADGTTIGQSRAIMRFIAKHIDGLYPNDALLAARVDEFMDVADDITDNMQRVIGMGLEKDAKEAARLESCTTGVMANLFKSLDDAIGKYGRSITMADLSIGKCSVGSKLTMADLCITMALTMFTYNPANYDGVPSDILKKYTNIEAVRMTVLKHPAVKKWFLEDRPKLEPIGLRKANPAWMPY